MKSPLRYPGGKTRAISVLDKFIPNNTKEICSPFFGGGSFELHLIQNRNIKVCAYDLFKPLVCFWKSLLTNKEKLHEIVNSLYPLEKSAYYELQNKINTIDDELEIGALLYVLNRCSFSGTGLSGGMSNNHPRFTKKQIDSLLSFNVEFEIEQESFETSIPKHDCLIFADPPYLLPNAKLYGRKGDMQAGFNHKLLADILNDMGNFILTYNNCQEVIDMYKHHSVFYPQWKYGMSNNKASNEIIIVSNGIV